MIEHEKKKTKKSNKNERIWDVEKIISETKQKEALLRQGKIAPAQKKKNSASPVVIIIVILAAIVYFIYFFFTTIAPTINFN